MGQGFDGARVVTMKGVDIDRLNQHAPELDLFLGAVHPACDLVLVEQVWDVFTDGSAQHTTAASFRVGEGRLDLGGALAFTSKALKKAKLKRLARDEEKQREVFALGEGCVRCAPARVLLGAGIADVLRVDRLDPCPAGAVASALPPQLAEAARAQSLGAPSCVRVRIELDPASFGPPVVLAEAVLAGPERPVTLMLDDGVVSVV